MRRSREGQYYPGVGGEKRGNKKQLWHFSDTEGIGRRRGRQLWRENAGGQVGGQLVSRVRCSWVRRDKGGALPLDLVIGDNQ